MPLAPLQRIFLHMVRDLALCDHMGDVGNDIESWAEVFGVEVPMADHGFDLDAIDEWLACERPGGRADEFKALVRAGLAEVPND